LFIVNQTKQKEDNQKWKKTQKKNKKILYII